MQNWRLSFDFDQLRLLLLINIIFWVISIPLGLLVGAPLFEMLVGWSREYLEIQNLLGALFPPLVLREGEWWRLVTSAFMHLNLIHLGLNMFALWQFGRVVYEYYGGKLLFTFYVLTAIVASFASLWFLPNTFTLGASGAVFGILGVILANAIKKNPYAHSFPVDRDYILQIVIYSLVIGFIPGLAINMAAHIGGLVAGFGLGYLFDHKLSAHRNQLSQKLEKPLYWLSLAIVGLSILLVSANFIYGFLFNRATW